MLRENLDQATTVVGLDVKVLAGVVFTEIVARRFAKAGDALPAGLLGRYPNMRAALVLARAASPSPAAIDASVVGACREGGLSAPAIIELVTWISVLQMLHRLSSYFVE